MSEEPTTERLVILNRLLSKTVSRAPAGIGAPMHGFKELLQILQARVKGGLAVELVGSRLQTGRDGPQERIRIREIKVLEEGEWGFAMILLEHVDEHATSFPVVNTWLKELAAGKPGDHNSPGPTPAE